MPVRSVVVWEFRVRSEAIIEFEEHYGPTGSWAMLFRAAPGYIDTRLLADASTRGLYLTIDRWRSEKEYDTFRRAHAADYGALDDQCRRLTHEEREIGRYTER